MKNIYITKDSYMDNSVRVNYFEKDSIRKTKIPQFNQETKELEIIEREDIYDKLLFCERLTWVENESELDSVIENRKMYLEET